jgi:hypothetical protein
MPIDIKELRVDAGGDPEKWRENQRRRFKDASIVDRVLEYDQVRDGWCALEMHTCVRMGWMQGGVSAHRGRMA